MTHIKRPISLENIENKLKWPLSLVDVNKMAILDRAGEGDNNKDDDHEGDQKIDEEHGPCYVGVACATGPVHEAKPDRIAKPVLEH